jgi:hypothetical protein
MPAVAQIPPGTEPAKLAANLFETVAQVPVTVLCTVAAGALAT